MGIGFGLVLGQGRVRVMVEARLRVMVRGGATVGIRVSLIGPGYGRVTARVIVTAPLRRRP